MASSYAKGTQVPVEQTKGEIEKLLRKHGAKQVLSAWDSDAHTGSVICRIQGRALRWRICVPVNFEVKRKGVRGRLPDQTRASAREEMRRWRSLLLIIRAKLEMIEAGDSAFELEFLANIMLPGGETVAEKMLPVVAEAYADDATSARILTAAAG